LRLSNCTYCGLKDRMRSLDSHKIMLRKLNMLLICLIHTLRFLLNYKFLRNLVQHFLALHLLENAFFGPILSYLAPISFLQNLKLSLGFRFILLLDYLHRLKSKNFSCFWIIYFLFLWLFFLITFFILLLNQNYLYLFYLSNQLLCKLINYII
jgi:hypothetical protein